MNELRALRRIRPEIEPLDEASYRRIWSDITGTPWAAGSVNHPTDSEPAPTFDLEAVPRHSGGSPPRSGLMSVAAALVVVGVGAVVGASALRDRADQTAPAARAPAGTVPISAEPTLPAPTVEQTLLLPAADVEPVYVQHNPAMPYRSRGLVSTPDGATISVNLFENFWGELSADMDQRTINGSIWATTLEDVSRGYVTLGECTMLSLNAGPVADVWDPDVWALMSGVRFADPISIELPGGWQLIELGSVGDWYAMTFDPAIAGVPSVTLTQMPGSNAGPLLADHAGRPIETVSIDGNPGWRVALDEDGWNQTTWQNEHGSMMLTSKGLTAEAITQLVGELVPASVSDWDDRYRDQNVGSATIVTEPRCEPAHLRVLEPG